MKEKVKLKWLKKKVWKLPNKKRTKNKGYQNCKKIIKNNKNYNIRRKEL
jgi:hypothetical protein